MLIELAASLLLTQASPVGSDFAATFGEQAVASHLEGKVAYLVAAAGQPTPALAAAASAFEEGLLRSGRADLVMNGSSLGPVAALDDQALVKRCEPLPVARVAVVRVFESAGEAPRAVVTVYDKRGAVQVAFTAQAGQPLAPGRKGVAGAGQGVSPGVAQAVIQAGGGQAQEEYDQAYVGFDEIAAVSRHGQLLEWTRPTQGKYRRPLEGDEFYRLIGRDDLVAAYHANQGKRTGVIVAGVAIGIGIPLLALASNSSKTCPPLGDPAWWDCTSSNHDAEARTALIAVLGATAGVVVAVIGATSVKLQPVDGPEARRLADEYNKKLKARLGLAQVPVTERPRPETEVAISLVPIKGGGLVGLALRF
jgi:hypothetical protein